MKHLVIYAHPNPNRLNSHLKNTLVEHLEQENHKVIVRDLYALNFNPVLSFEDMADWFTCYNEGIYRSGFQL